MVHVLVLLMLGMGMATAVSDQPQPSGGILVVPDDVLLKICFHHLPDLKDIAHLICTCQRPRQLLTSSLREIRDLFNPELPEVEFNFVFRNFMALSLHQPGNCHTIYSDPYTALSLYERCISGRYDSCKSNYKDIVKVLVRRVNPIVLSAAVASRPVDDHALRDILDLMSSVSYSAVPIPEVPLQIKKAIAAIVDEIPEDLPASLNAELCSKIRDGLSHFGAPFDRIFPHNELVADRLLSELHRFGLTRSELIDKHEVILALAWRGIRFNARLSKGFLYGMPPKHMCSTFRIGNTVSELFLTLHDAVMSHLIYHGLPRLFEYVPELRSRLYYILTDSVAEFPWKEFCDVFCPELQDQQPIASAITNNILKMAHRAYLYSEDFTAEFLLTCADAHGHADVELSYSVVEMFVKCKLSSNTLTAASFDQFLQRPLFCNLDYLDIIWFLMRRGYDLGGLLPHFMQRPDFPVALRTSKLELLLSIVRMALSKDKCSYLDHLHYFVDVPDVVQILEDNMSAYVEKIRFAFIQNSYLKHMTRQNHSPPPSLLSATKFPFWPQLLNSKDNKNGATLLHWAYYYHHIGALQILLSCPNIDRYPIDNHGRGPLFWFVQYTNIPKDILTLLVEALPIRDPSYQSQIVTDFDRTFKQLRVPLQRYNVAQNCLKHDFLRRLLTSTLGWKMYFYAVLWGGCRALAMPLERCSATLLKFLSCMAD